MMQFVFCQITPTKKQIQQIKEITTPEKLINYSKGLSNEKKQRKAIDSLQKIIKEKDKRFISLMEKHKQDIIELSKNNSFIQEGTKELEETNKEIIKKSKPNRKYISVIGEIEIPKLNFSNPILKTDLIIDFKNIKTGVRGSAKIKENKMTYDWSLVTRITIF